MPSALLSILIAAVPMLATEMGGVVTPEDVEAEPQVVQGAIETPKDLLGALAEKDAQTTTLMGTIRYTTIDTLANDRQVRIGKVSIKNSDNEDSSASRKYAVRFSNLTFDDRQEEIDEHYIFDGRWFIERLPEEKQFNKRELVPEGRTLDPMELMRDAPFWVSLGRDQDRLLKSYDAELLATTDGLVDNPNFPELRFLAEMPHVADTTQLKLVPKEGSGFEDDWEWVRIWVNTETDLPVMYIKSDWTGDLQVVELFGTKTNTDIPDSVFDTTAPDETSGWRVQISHWRGDS